MTDKNNVYGKEDVSPLYIDKNGEISLARLWRWLNLIEDRTSMSLPAYLKRAVVESRTYITREAAIEECINDLLYCLNVMYAGWCMTAMSMNQMVYGSKVRDIIQTVATESMNPDVFYKNTEDAFSALESFKQVKSPFTMISPVIPHDPEIEDDIAEGVSGDIVGAGSTKNRVVEFPKNYRLTEGIVIDISLNTERGSTLTVPIAVRLNPTIITSEVAKQFFAANFKLDAWMRFFKVKTGEISFFKDFLFELDLLKEETEAIKHDKTGELKAMLDSRRNSLLDFCLKILGWRVDRQNIASAIHIYTKSQFDEYCRQTHCNFNNVNDRLKYFRATLSMIVAVIDNDYQNVDMYIAGIGSKARYQFNQLQNFTKPNQYDLTSIMRAFSSSTAPRF